MAGKYESKLAQLGITLDPVPTPVANYVPFVITGNLVYVSGQVCRAGGKVTHKGKLGAELTVEEGQAAARVCAISIMAVLKLALGDLDRVVRCVSVRGFVASAPTFFEQPSVINGASNLIVEVFGDAGRHSRTAIGVAALPADCAVEVDAVFEIR